MAGILDWQTPTSCNSGRITVEIVEQPKEFFRFRNEDEDGKHGTIQGRKSTYKKKSYPTIKISGYDGKVKVKVSLLNSKHEKHVYYLRGRAEDKKTDYIKDCVVKKEGTEISFDDFYVLQIKDKKACEIFKTKWCQMRNLDPNKLIPQQKRQLHSDTVEMKSQLKEVILFFEVIPEGCMAAVANCCSTLIKYLKNFKITTGECSHYTVPSSGNKIVFLATGTPKRANDLKIIFSDGNGWTAEATHIYTTNAFMFKVPPYKSEHLNKQVEVYFKIQRGQNEENCSEEIEVMFEPDDAASDELKRKKAKLNIFTGVPFKQFLGPSNSPGVSSLDNPGPSSSSEKQMSLVRVEQACQTVQFPPSERSKSSHKCMGNFFCHQNPEEWLDDLIKMLPEDENLEECSLDSLAQNVPATVSSSTAQFIPSEPARVSQNTEMGMTNPLVDYNTSTYQPTWYDFPSFQSTGCEAQMQEVDGYLSNQFGNLEANHYNPNDAGVQSLSQLPAPKEKDKEWQFHPKDGDKDTLEINSDQVSDQNLIRRGVAEFAKNVEDDGDLTLDSINDRDISLSPQNEMKMAKSRFDLGNCLAMQMLTVIRNYAKKRDTTALLNSLKYFGMVSNGNFDKEEMNEMFHHLNISDSISTTNIWSQTPMQWAVYNNNARMLDYLLKHGARCDVIDHKGNNPVHIATRLGFIEIIKTLSANSVSLKVLNALNFDGNAPLHIAVLSNNLNIVKELCSAGANVNIQDGLSKSTPMQIAIENEFYPIIDFLLDQKSIDLDIQNVRGNTALHLSCITNKEVLVELLLKAGADPYIENAETLGDEENYSTEDLSGLKPIDCTSDKKIKEILQRYMNSDLKEVNDTVLGATGYSCSNTAHSFKMENITEKSSTSVTQLESNFKDLKIESKVLSAADERYDDDLLMRLAELFDPKFGWKILSDLLNRQELNNTLEKKPNPTFCFLRHIDNYELDFLVEMLANEEALALLESYKLDKGI